MEEIHQFQLLESTCFNFESKYLTFIPAKIHNPATWIIDVFTITDDGDILLGKIKYYAHWRQYAFYPEQGTVFEKTCLNDITNFVRTMNDLQKRGIKPQVTLSRKCQV